LIFSPFVHGNDIGARGQDFHVFVNAFKTGSFPNEGKADAALAASIFHFNEIPIPSLKKYLDHKGVCIRTDF
jgi:imidazole glycerol phosphate synthase subunit HisF